MSHISNVALDSIKMSRVHAGSAWSVKSEPIQIFALFGNIVKKKCIGVLVVW